MYLIVISIQSIIVKQDAVETICKDVKLLTMHLLLLFSIKKIMNFNCKAA